MPLRGVSTMVIIAFISVSGQQVPTLVWRTVTTWQLLSKTTWWWMHTLGFREVLNSLKRTFCFLWKITCLFLSGSENPKTKTCCCCYFIPWRYLGVGGVYFSIFYITDETVLKPKSKLWGSNIRTVGVKHQKAVQVEEGTIISLNQALGWACRPVKTHLSYIHHIRAGKEDKIILAIFSAWMFDVISPLLSHSLRSAFRNTSHVWEHQLYWWENTIVSGQSFNNAR